MPDQANNPKMDPQPSKRLELGPRSTPVPDPSEDARLVVGQHLARALASGASGEYERRVLTSPGVAEGFDQVYDLIEDWKRTG